jgi:tetraacyldisaccharide 4'-kinase
MTSRKALMTRDLFHRLPGALRTGLQGAGKLYSGLMQARQGLYERGWLRSWRPETPCISVGNISWGGSGKTPLCEWILKWCLEKDLVPALLTRGYGASPSSLPYRVTQDSPVDEAGDEALMLARACGETAPIVVDPRRTRGGQWVWQAEAPDIFVLDDGFQHLAVQRDIDLVLLTHEDLTRDWSAVIPGGPWREGPQALNRARAFLVNAPPDRVSALSSVIKARLLPLGKPVFCFSLQAKGLARVVDHEPVQAMSADKVVLVSGVGSPDSVEASFRACLGADPAEHLRFPDHHSYTASDWGLISGRASALGSGWILCTSKDAVKLERFADSRLVCLQTGLEFGPSWPDSFHFPSWLADQLGL